MGMLKTLTAVVTSVAIGTPVELDQTPFLSRKVIRRCRALPLTSTVKLQGAPRDPDTKAVPASGSSAWVDLETLTSASAIVAEIGPMYDFIRCNCTVLDADGPDVVIDLEGVQ